jgi:hypothetical protein
MASNQSSASEENVQSFQARTSSKSASRREDAGKGAYETISQKPKMPQMGVNESYDLRTKRQLHRAMIRQKILDSRKEAVFEYTNKKTQKEENKLQMQKRLHTECFKDLSPYLNPLHNINMTTEERLIHYTKNHKCQHNRSYNIIEMVQCSCSEPRYMYRVSCDHQREQVTRQPGANKCRRCLRKTVMVYRNCDCTVVFCDWCRFSTYSLQIAHECVTKIVCVCGKNYNQPILPNILVTRLKKKKMWKATNVPKVTVVNDIDFPPLNLAVDDINFPPLNHKTEAHSGRMTQDFVRTCDECDEVMEDGVCYSCLEVERAQNALYAEQMNRMMREGERCDECQKKGDLHQGLCIKCRSSPTTCVCDGKRTLRCLMCTLLSMRGLPCGCEESCCRERKCFAALSKFFLPLDIRQRNLLVYRLQEWMAIHPAISEAVRSIDVEKIPFIPSDMEAHGGAMSMAKSTVTSIGDGLSSFGHKVIDFIKLAYKTSTESVTSTYERARLWVKSTILVMRIRKIIDHMANNKILMTALVGNIIALVTTEGRIPQFATLCSTLLIIWGIAQSGAINIKDLQKEVQTNQTELSASDIQTVDITQVAAEVDKEVEEAFGNIVQNPSDNEAHGFDTLLPTFLEKITMLLGFSALTIKKAWPFAQTAFKAMLAMCAVRKALTDYATYFVQFLPDWLRALTIAGNTKLLIKTQIVDSNTPLGKAYRSAMAMKIAAEDGMDVEITNPLKKKANSDYREWLRYMHEKAIAPDADIVKLNQLLEEYGNALCKSKARRFEPFMIRIAGDSGVGKSTVWPVLLSYLPGFEECETKDEINEKVYTRCITDEFWSSYNSTYKCVRYDDFGQQRDEIDFQEIIGIGGEAPFMPQMPSINPKDTNIGVKGTQVTVDYVLMLSNTHSFNPTTLTSREALERRKHVQLSIKFKKGVHKRAADFSHMEIKLEFSRYQNAPPGLVFASIQEAAEFVKQEHIFFLQSQKEVVQTIDSMLFANTKHKLGLDRVQQVIADVALLKESKKELDNKETSICQNILRGDRLDDALKNLKLQKSSITAIDDMQANGGDMLDKEERADLIENLREEHRKHEDQWQRYYDNLANNYIQNMQKKEFSIWEKTCTYMRQGVKSFGAFVYDIITTTLDLAYYALIGCVTGMVVSLGMIKFLQWMYPQEAQSGTTKTVKYTEMKMRPNGGNADDIARLLHQNVIRLQCPDTRQEQCGLFVSGSTIILNEHFFISSEPGERYIPKGTMIYFISETTKEAECFPFDPQNIVALEGEMGSYKDAVLYRLPKSIVKRRDIVSHFWDGTLDMRNRSVMHIQIDKHQKPKTTVCRVFEDNSWTTYPLNVNGKITEVNVQGAVYYHYRSEKGDCGSPVMAMDDCARDKILGFHISGSPSTETSVLTVITKSMLLEGLDKLDAQTWKEVSRETVAHSLIIPADRDDVEKANLDGKLSVYGILHKSISPPIKTTIIGSPLHDEITPPVTKPAHLNHAKIWREEGIDLLRKGANKYSHHSDDIPDELIDEVRESMEVDLFSRMDTTVPLRKLTLHEAINGNPDYEFINPLNMTTSPGYPWVLDPRFRGPKKLLFDYTPNGYVPKPILQTSIDDTLEKLKQGIIPEMPYVDSLKDERRPIAKVDQYKTRLFSICPLTMTIIGRMYQLGFLAHLMQKRTKIWSMIGINKNSIEWELYYMHLAQMGTTNCFDGDYTEFDGRLHKKLSLLHFKLCDRFYERFDPDWTLMDSLVREVIGYFHSESMHIIYCVVFNWMICYLCNGGNPSGQDGTTPTNTNGNEGAMRLAWLKLAPVHLKDLYYYRKFVANAIYGDDIVTSIRMVARDFFGPDKIQQAMETFSMKYGPADKLTATGHFDTLENCTFLKNATGDFHGRKVPLMNEEALLETINWIRQDKNSPPPEQACEDNCNAVLRNLMFYGPEKFNQIRRSILLKKPGYHLLTYTYLRDEFLQTGSLIDPFNDNGCGVHGEKRMFHTFEQ